MGNESGSHLGNSKLQKHVEQKTSQPEDAQRMFLIDYRADDVPVSSRGPEVGASRGWANPLEAQRYQAEVERKRASCHNQLCH
ncbi:MAG: hypothetical protein ABSG33_10880 [Candidatus Bathyarchaeia archaeon]|jgi:hypothetical protein